MKFCDESIKVFLDELGLDLLVLGGGSVVGFVLVLLGLLNFMVYLLIVGKKSYLLLSDSE